MADREILLRLGGASLLLFIPMLLAGSVLFAQIGISSRSEGADALRRIASAGASFAVMSGLFHLGALLLIPGAAALAVAVRGGDRDDWLILGTIFLVIAVTVGAGFVFALNHGLCGIAIPFRDAPAVDKAAYVVAANLNLRTQAAAELVQSVGLGLWVLCTSVAISAAGWPAWTAWLGFAGGVGFIAAGLSSVLLDLPLVGPALAASGALGLLIFAGWLVTMGWRLLTVVTPK
ncbi:MAG TPA: DUF4386 family protein [Candidatus Limnocylindrales bacterium]